MKLRAVMADDEELARRLLREHLSKEPDIEIVAECSNGFEAVKAINETKPDLVFLDIQMPKLDGYEVLELIDDNVAVVFVTAFDQYAMKAFDAAAVDYLLKPFPVERLRSALSKVRDRKPAPLPTDPHLRTNVGGASARAADHATPPSSASVSTASLKCVFMGSILRTELVVCRESRGYGGREPVPPSQGMTPWGGKTALEPRGRGVWRRGCWGKNRAWRARWGSGRHDQPAREPSGRCPGVGHPPPSGHCRRPALPVSRLFLPPPAPRGPGRVAEGRAVRKGGRCGVRLLRGRRPAVVRERRRQ